MLYKTKEVIYTYCNTDYSKKRIFCGTQRVSIVFTTIHRRSLSRATRIKSTPSLTLFLISASYLYMCSLIYICSSSCPTKLFCAFLIFPMRITALTCCEEQHSTSANFSSFCRTVSRVDSDICNTAQNTVGVFHHSCSKRQYCA